MGWQKFLPPVPAPEPIAGLSASDIDLAPSWDLFRWEIVVQRGKTSTKFRGSGSFARIGGESRCEVFLRQAGSPVIAYLQFVDGGMLFVDLSQPLVERVKPMAVLLGTSMKLGEGTWITLSSLRSFRAPLQESGKQADSLFIVDRSVKTGRSTGTSFRIPKGISLLGASSACQLQLKHRTLSPFHSVVYRPSNPKLPVRIIDLCSFPTTLIDGTIAVGGCVLPGSTVRIGKLSFVAKESVDTSLPEPSPLVVESTELFSNSADAQKESPVSFTDDHKAVEMGVTNDVAFMSRETVQCKASPPAADTRSDPKIAEILAAIDRLGENLGTISSRLDVLEKRLDSEHSPAPIPSGVGSGDAWLGEKTTKPIIQRSRSDDFSNLHPVTWPTLHSESNGTQNDFQIVAEKDEVLVLDRLVALRTTQAFAKKRVFFWGIAAMACLLAVAIPVLWVSVPAGWRERIIHELVHRNPGVSELEPSLNNVNDVTLEPSPAQSPLFVDGR